jgi:hypothetical protein
MKNFNGRPFFFFVVFYCARQSENPELGARPPEYLRSVTVFLAAPFFLFQKREFSGSFFPKFLRLRKGVIVVVFRELPASLAALD